MLPLAKVAYVPDTTFFPVRQETNHARVSFSGIADDRLIHGITAIADLLHEALR
jgi:2-aminoadipate transaminase